MTESGCPSENAADAFSYELRWRRSATSGTPSPAGSSPPATIVSRAAALATTPLASSNGRSVSSRPCTIATCTGAGHGDEIATPASFDQGRGKSQHRRIVVAPIRPAGPGRRPARVCSLASTWSGERSQTEAIDPIAAAARKKPARTGSVTVPAPHRAVSGAPSSAADALAARIDAIAEVPGQPVRFAGWRRSAVIEVLTSSTAAVTSGGARQYSQGADRGDGGHRSTIRAATTAALPSARARLTGDGYRPPQPVTAVSRPLTDARLTNVAITSDPPSTHYTAGGDPSALSREEVAEGPAAGTAQLVRTVRSGSSPGRPTAPEPSPSTSPPDTDTDVTKENICERSRYNVRTGPCHSVHRTGQSGHRGANVPALDGVRGPGESDSRGLRAGRRRLRRLLGPSRRIDCPGRRRSARCWTGPTPARQVVRRREAQRRLQLRGPACRGRVRRHRRDPLGGRTRRLPHHHLCGAAARGLQDRERADLPRAARPATGWRSTCR